MADYQKQLNNSQVYTKEIPIASSLDSSVSSSSLAAGSRVSPELKKLLEAGALGLRVEKLIDLGDTKTAVFTTTFQAIDSQGKKVSEPIALKPPIIVSDVGDDSYVKRKQTLLLEALESQVKTLPQFVVIPRDKDSPLVLAIDRMSCPLLWEEMQKGAVVKASIEQAFKEYSFLNLKITSSDGIESNVVGIQQRALENSAKVLEFEAKRINDLRMPNADEEQIRAKMIGIRGVVLSENKTYVTSTTELGNYFCEAMMFVPQYLAEYDHGTSILKNSKKEPLTGFIHIPSDRYASKSVTLAPDQLLERHKHHSMVIGKAMLGYVHQALEAQPNIENFKILLAGYHGFVQNNPSGEFCISERVVKSAIAHGFGVDPGSIKLISKNLPIKLEAEISFRNKEIKLEILGNSFDVNSTSLDFGPKSVQTLIRTEKPNAVIGMGVRPGVELKEKFYDAGCTADATFLMQTSALRKAFNLSGDFALPNNNSLPAAIYIGDQILKVRNSSD